MTLVSDDFQGPGSRPPARIIVRRLARGDRAHASFELDTHRRGVVEAGAYQAVISDPLGLARRRLSVCRPARCVVLPCIEPLPTVVPERGATRAGRALSLAERLAASGAMLRRYAQGDDLRRVHWRTTARLGELMVREGEDDDERGRIATTVLLDVGDGATPPEELDRAVEVAASVLFAAADESSNEVSGTYRLLTTAELDTGSRRGRDGLASVLVALAGVGAAVAPSAGRFRAAVERLGRSDHDEVLVVVGAFGSDPPDPGILADLARVYRVVVLVLVGAAHVSRRAQMTDADDADPGTVPATGAHVRHDGSGGRRGAVVTVPLPLGTSLADAWRSDLQGPDAIEDGSGWLGRPREVVQ